MSNINRDYLIVLNPKTSKVTVPELNYYIYDKYTANLFVNLVTIENGKVVNMVDADQYKLVLHVLKPTNEIQTVENIQVFNKEKALFQIELDAELTKNIGRYKCELLTIDQTDHIVQSAKFSYRVKKSIYNDLDVVTETPQYPIIITLLDKLQDIDKYEEERRANEVARVAAEKARVKDYTDLRKTVTTDIDTMQQKIDSFDGKVQEVDNAVTQMRTNITDYQTKKNTELDNYKTQKDTQINTAIKGMETTIDKYKTAKDTEINDKITQQDNTIAANNQAQNKVISDAIAEQNKTINTVVESDKVQNDRLDILESNSDSFMYDINELQDKDVGHEERMTAIEGVNVEQNNRLDAIEIKNDQQDGRLNDVEAKNKKQDMDLKCLFAESHSERITLDDEVGNSVFLQNSKQGFATIDELKGNTLVNCNKDTDKELILNGNIDTSGYSTVTTTEGVDGGKVDVVLEGNTMVNVCDQEEPVAITKNYEVTTGNHVALQGEYDGKCRPNIYGNTLVSWQGSKDVNKGQQVTINSQYQTNSIHTLNTTVGDKVYFRIKFTVDEMNTTSPDPKIFTGYSMGYKIDVKAFKDCTVGKIEEASTIREHEQARADQNRMDLCIGMYAPMPEDVPAGGVVCKYTIYDYVIYNLTQLFGAGKEPQQEWCDKNLPYLEGMKSSFEDKLITDEKDAHSGKYKVDYKVTGKNKFDVNKLVTGGINTSNGVDNDTLNACRTGFIKLESITYKLTKNTQQWQTVIGYDNKFNYLCVIFNANVSSGTFTIPENVTYVRFKFDYDTDVALLDNIQLEEGDTATTYEPYKEYTKTLYLNSPLLEGDTIEQSGNDIVHVHRYGKVVLDGTNYDITRSGTNDSTKYRWVLYKNDNILKFTGDTSILINNKYPLSSPSGTWGTNNKYIEGITINSQDSSILLYLGKYKDGSADSKASLKAELQQNPVTVVYKLATPTKEVISTNDNLLLDSYVNGHLDMDSVVPIDKVVFQSNFNKSLRYLYPNTEYTIQFESDNNGILNALAINDYDTLSNLNIVKGINKFNITTSAKINANYLWTTGIGFNASKIVVTPKVEQPFGYFKGMKSVGECEDLEVVSKNKNLFTSEVIDALCTLENWVGNGAYRNNYVAYNLMNFKDGITYTNTIPDIKVPPKFYPILFLDNTNNGNFIPSGWYENNTDNEKTVSGNKFTFTGKNEGHFRAYVSNWNEENMQKLRKVLEQNIQVEIGNNSTGFVAPKSNKQTITHEPLRGLPNGTKDKYVIIDGKWYIKRNCRAVQFKDLKYSRQDTYLNDAYPDIMGLRLLGTGINAPIMCDKFAYSNNRVISAGQLITNKEGINIVGNEFFMTIQRTKLKTLDFKGIMNYFTENPTEIIAKATTPTYEPIEYNPFEVYAATTHISNNSTIPCNMVIRNSGFNCILKPNTTYTVSSNNGLSSVTTKASIGDGILRFYDKDTTSVTKMSKVLVLEGDYITGNPPIPAFFKGMESAFEQELVTDEQDKNYGKYKVNVKAVGKNLFNKDTIIKGKYQNCNTTNGNFNISSNSSFNITDFVPVKPNTQYTISGTNMTAHVYYNKNKEPITTVVTKSLSFTTPSNVYYMVFNLRSTDDLNKVQIEQGSTATEYEPYKENNITFYLKEPLRGVGDIKDKVYVKEDKVVVERNCVNFVLEPTQIPSYAPNSKGIYTYNISVNSPIVNTAYGEVVCNSLPCDVNNAHNRNYANTISTVVDQSVPNGVIRIITDKDPETLKQWLQANPTTVVYQLATPTYEEVEYFDMKLFVEIFKDTTIIYNSNIPVTSTINYTYSTPLTDAVNTVSDISDEQDSMIIDMATQVATMEMMLM